MRAVRTSELRAARALLELAAGAGKSPAAGDGAGALVEAPPALTASDVRLPNIDVAAQRAMVRLSRRPALARAIHDLLGALVVGRVGGIYQEDQKVPALRAQRWGTGWWRVIPRGRDGAVMLDPDGARGAPVIVIRRNLEGSPERVDAALLEAWSLARVLRARERSESIAATTAGRGASSAAAHRAPDSPEREERSEGG